MPIHLAFAHPYTFWVLSRMASIKSRQEESRFTKGAGDNCAGHNCDKTNCCKGHGNTIANGHDRDSEGQIPSKDYAELRHANNRRGL